MDDLHGPAAEHVGRPDQHRKADALGHRARLLGRGRGAVLGLIEPGLGEQLLEPAPVLGQVDGVRRGAEDRDFRGLERVRQLERRLAAELHDHAEQAAAGLLDAGDLDHVLGGQRLEIEPVGGVVVGRDRLRVAVDHDGLDARVLERVGGVNAAVVELDALADAVRAAAQDDHLVAVAGVGLALGRARPGVLVGRIHVGRRRGEFAGAGVDALVDRPHAPGVTPAGDRRLGGSGEDGQARVRKAQALQARKAVALVGQAVGPELGLDRDQIGDLGQEPGVELGRPLDLVEAQAVAQGLGDGEHALRARLGQLGQDRLPVDRAFGAQRARDLDLVEAAQAGLQGAQRLLQGFGEAAPDRHGLADRLHGDGQERLGARELLEGEARYLGDHVVDRGLEGGRRHPGDVVVEFVEGVADRQLGRDLGDREAGRLGRQRGRARHPRVHLDDDQLAVVRVDRELHVGAPGIDPDLAQAGDRGVAHVLEFLVGQGQRRRHGDRIAGVDAHGVEVLDRADDDAVVGAVAHHLHLEFLPAEHRLLDQHLADRRGAQAGEHDVLELVAVVGDAGAEPAQGIGRPDDGRQLDVSQRRARRLEALDDARARHGEADALHRRAEQVALLGLGDDLGVGADHLDAVRLQHPGARQLEAGVERRLPAHGRQQRVGLLALDDLGDDLEGDRLDVGGIRQARVGHDGRRVGVDQDHPVALGAQGLARLDAGIVELAGLPDHDRPGADDQDRGDVGALGHSSGELRVALNHRGTET